METELKHCQSNQPAKYGATILILEDEIYNFRLLRQQLLEINADYDVIGPVTTVEETRMFLSHHRDIDLIIADIQLNDGLSFDALSYASDDIPIIFITAYDEYALKAFEYNSLSYLLKPIDDDDLRKALHKAFRATERRGNREDYKESYKEKKEENREKGQERKAIPFDISHRNCFLVKTPRGERRVHVSMVRFAVSENKTTYIHLLDGTSYPVDLTLTELAAQLSPDLFMRVNRKFILPIEQVKGLQHLPNGRLQILLFGDDGPEIVVSRDMHKKVVEWLKK